MTQWSRALTALAEATTCMVAHNHDASPCPVQALDTRKMHTHTDTQRTDIKINLSKSICIWGLGI